MEYALHDLTPVECLLSTACFSTQYGRPFPLACLRHAALTGMNGSLADINVESPACGARSKTTVVRKPQWRKLFFNAHYRGGCVRFWFKTHAEFALFFKIRWEKRVRLHFFANFAR